MDDDLLTPEEAARLLRTTRNTIYRWCRDGKLPARKVGGVWRIPGSTLRAAPVPPPVPKYADWPSVLDRLLAQEEGSHWLVVTERPTDVYDVEASFISRGLGTGRRIIKGSWWQPMEVVRSELAKRGIDVAAAERAGALVLLDMEALLRQGGIAGVVSRWRELVDGAATLGYRGVWKIGSPALDDRAPFEWVAEVEEAACRFFSGSKAHAVCPIYTAAEHPEWHTRLTRLLGTHGVAVYRSANQSTLLRLAS
jgi:excisionase family DNA binding protein